MAADRGRDLTFSILSDTDKLDLAGPAQDLDTLATSATEAGRALDTLDQADGRGVERVGQAADDAKRDLEALDTAVRGVDLDRLAEDAKRTATKVDSAFDTIAKSSKASASRLDDNTKAMKIDLDDVGDEAADTAREMGASFDGSSDSIIDAFQEFGSLAGASLGPIGVAAGAAAATGVGLIRAEQEKLKEMATEMVEKMIEAGGQLDDAAIESRIQSMVTEDPQAFVKQKEAVEALGLAWEDYIRAKAGDGDAAERSLQQIADLSTALTDQAAASGSASGAMYAQQTKLNELAGELGTTAEAYGIAKAAVDGLAQATRDTEAPIVNAQGNWDDLRGGMKNPITGKITLRRPPPSEYSAMRAAIERGVGVIPVRLRVSGQSPFANNANNSRYRD